MYLIEEVKKNETTSSFKKGTKSLESLLGPDYFKSSIYSSVFDQLSKTNHNLKNYLSFLTNTKEVEENETLGSFNDNTNSLASLLGLSYFGSGVVSGVFDQLSKTNLNLANYFPFVTNTVIGDAKGFFMTLAGYVIGRIGCFLYEIFEKKG